MRQRSLAESALFIRGAAAILLLVLVLACAVSLLGTDLGPNVLVERRLAPGTTIVTELVSMSSVLFFAIALVQLIRLLSRLGSGELFAPGVTRAFRSFAFWLMLSAIVSIVGPPLAGLGSALFAGGTDRVAIKVDLRDVMFLIAGLLLFLVARMLDEAARLDAELREIV